MKRKILVVLIAVLCLCSLFSCQKSRESTSDGNAIDLTDALGRQVSVPKSPKRVAALLGSFADVWELAGGELCACPEDAWEDFGLDPEGATNIGGAHSPSLELLISSNPELVIASASTASNVEMADTLDRLGIATVYFDVDNFEDYLNMLDVCTDITGRKDLYERHGTALLEEINDIKAGLEDAEIPAEQRKILLVRASSSSLKAKGSRGTVLGEMLCDLGCVNIADGSSALLENLSAESIMASDPYRIFAVTMGDSASAEKALLSLINGNPAWAELSAVKAGRVHVMDKKLFNLKPNAAWAEAYRVLYEILTETQ